VNPELEKAVESLGTSGRTPLTIRTYRRYAHWFLVYLSAHRLPLDAVGVDVLERFISSEASRFRRRYGHGPIDFPAWRSHRLAAARAVLDSNVPQWRGGAEQVVIQRSVPICARRAIA